MFRRILRSRFPSIPNCTFQKSVVIGVISVRTSVSHVALLSCSWMMALWNTLMMSWRPSCYMSLLIFVYIWFIVFGLCDVYVGRMGWCSNTQAPIVGLSNFVASHFHRMSNVLSYSFTGSICCGVNWARFSCLEKLFLYCQHLHELETNDTSTDSILQSVEEGTDVWAGDYNINGGNRSVWLLCNGIIWWRKCGSFASL
jgi:hypothetical protein